MKRFVIFLLILIAFVGIYNLSTLQNSVSGFFGDHSYRKGDFLNAEKRYSDTLDTYSGSILLKADILYNLGNALYRIGEKETGTKRTDFWKESIGSYTKSLSIRTDKETEENLAFVKEKLQEEQQEQERKKQEEEQKSDPGSGQNSDPTRDDNNKNSTGTGQKWDSGNSPQTKDRSETGSGSTEKRTNVWSGNTKDAPQPWKSWSNGGSYNPIGGQDKDNADSPLSDADRQEIQKYLEDLKRFEKQNGKLLNPETWGGAGSISDQIRNFFGNDSFFQDVLPSNDGKKDW